MHGWPLNLSNSSSVAEFHKQFSWIWPWTAGKLSPDPEYTTDYNIDAMGV